MVDDTILSMNHCESETFIAWITGTRIEHEFWGILVKWYKHEIDSLFVNVIVCTNILIFRRANPAKPSVTPISKVGYGGILYLVYDQTQLVCLRYVVELYGIANS